MILFLFDFVAQCGQVGRWLLSKSPDFGARYKGKHILAERQKYNH